MSYLFRFVRRVGFAYKNMIALYKVSGYLMYTIVNPFLQMVFYCTVASFVYGKADMAPWVIGNALVLSYHAAFFGVGQAFNRERLQGTLAPIIASPTATLNIVMPKVVLMVSESVISICIGFITGWLFFGFSMPINRWPEFMLITAVAIFAALSSGLLIGAFGLLTRDIFLLLNLAAQLLIALSGSNFHVELLPFWLQKAASVLPLTRSIQLLRFMAKGKELSQHMSLLTGELLLALIYLLTGILLYKIIERQALKKATIDLY